MILKNKVAQNINAGASRPSCTIFYGLLTLVCILFCPMYAQEIRLAVISVSTGSHDYFETPVSVALDGVLLSQQDGELTLYEVTAGERFLTPCQLENVLTPRLWWILSGATPAGTERTFELAMTDSPAARPRMEARQSAESILLRRNGASLLNYQIKTVAPPEGVSPLFARSGFIHPLWSPGGEVLTCIQPADHYHHYGIWNPWTKAIFQGREIDFWNLGSGQGTVRFAGLLSLISGDVYAGFKVRQEHVDLTQSPEIIALNELWDVRAWNVSDPSKLWMWDLSTTLNCATDSSILLEAYRYGGGLGFRAVESWTNQNSAVLTSEGKTRADADGSRARWCRVEGDDGNGGRMGILFMSHPANREHPEPMRVWPLDANNGRGDLFFEFCPIREKSWRLNPGRDYSLRYRMVVFSGELTVQQCEQAWQDFAFPAQVIIIPQ